jgi:7 transmembrane receptor (Secretin family)
VNTRQIIEKTLSRIFLNEIFSSLQLLCSIIAGVLHYLFLAAFAWMCLEGIQIYIMLVEVFEVEKSRIGWFYAAGYGKPCVFIYSTFLPVLPVW